MVANVIADTGFLVGLISDRDTHHRWAVAAADAHPPPWRTCEAVLGETYYILGPTGVETLSALLLRGAVLTPFVFEANAAPVLALWRKYANLPMSFADACLVRMSELASDPLVLTTDSDFSVYRRHGRKIIPCLMPG